MVEDYYWIVVVGGICAFWAAFGIGANDSANAFASSVGSKALTLGQAVIIASIFEFGGSVLMGSQVTDTIRSKIIDINSFKETPELLMFGMLAVVISVAIWLILASYLELPVSTTNSTVAGVIGIGLVHGGFDSVVWYKYDKSKDFLSKFQGVVPIFASWIISPILSAGLGALLFWLSRNFILRRQNSTKISYIFFPILVTITIAVNIYFIIYKGFQRTIDGEKLSEKLGDGYISLIAWLSGIFIGTIVYCVFIKWLESYHDNWEEKRIQNENPVELSVDIPNNTSNKNVIKRVYSFYKKLFSKDLHTPVLESDSNVQAIHDNAEKFNEKTEHTFSFIQIFTAAMDSFAHGANDVANSIGPFAAIWSIYDTSKVNSKANVPLWILSLGGFGIVVGLTLFGANLIRALGIKLSKITPSRGYSIELSSSIVVIIASIYGIPISTTHAQVGSTTGVALMEGKKGVNYLVLARVVFGMVSTMVFVGGLSACIYSFGVYSPQETF